MFMFALATLASFASIPLFPPNFLNKILPLLSVVSNCLWAHDLGLLAPQLAAQGALYLTRLGDPSHPIHSNLLIIDGFFNMTSYIQRCNLPFNERPGRLLAR